MEGRTQEEGFEMMCHIGSDVKLFRRSPSCGTWDRQGLGRMMGGLAQGIY